MKEEASEWLEQAEEDFETAEFLVDSGKTEQGGFFLQQAAEKALKAMLLEKDGDYPYEHNLVKLAKDLDVPDEYIDVFPVLNSLYVGSRYPDQHTSDIQNLEQIKSKVEEFLEWMKRQLEE